MFVLKGRERVSELYKVDIFWFWRSHTTGIICHPVDTLLRAWQLANSFVFYPVVALTHSVHLSHLNHCLPSYPILSARLKVILPITIQFPLCFFCWMVMEISTVECRVNLSRPMCWVVWWREVEDYLRFYIQCWKWGEERPSESQKLKYHASHPQSRRNNAHKHTQAMD